MEEKQVESMVDDDERKLWRNWTFLKHELRVEELTEGLFKAGRFNAETKEMILTVQPNTKFMKAEKFLSALIRSGIKGYKTFCKLMQTDPSNRYAEVMEKLGISDQDDMSDSVSQAESEEQRPISAKSSMSGGTGISSKDGETGEKKIKPSVPDILRQLPGPTNESGTTTPNLLTTPTSLIRQASVTSTPNNDTASAVYAVRTALESGETTNTVADLTALEKELVRIAPTIADLFQRITKSKDEQPNASSVEELNKLKEENERLRRTNRTLIEKLNIFQQQIINLQLENKKLRANDKCDQKSKEELNKRNQELENLRKKFEVQQQELERKEVELNTQLLKIHEIEEENERQKIQIMKLEVLHDESVDDRKEQQDQIEQLMKEKVHQQYQINTLTEKQSADEERLQKMEQRLLMLENIGSGSRASYWNNRSRDKNKRTTRVVSPPRSMPWMNGVLNRSHNANVKFNPPTPLNKPPQEKGWSF
ncbi:uncharacterized protein LOC134712357 [Mytilus trossulus]|uniref:uncharacterized protein LOC134712357 n=1 Tax=Mytilus trossulus TaxID=6551 RepID=UPI00300646E4